MPLLCLQWKTPDDGQRNCPKRVEFYSKNKLEQLVHLVGFIVSIYHDAQSPERQTLESEWQEKYGNRILKTDKEIQQYVPDFRVAGHIKMIYTRVFEIAVPKTENNETAYNAAIGICS